MQQQSVNPLSFQAINKYDSITIMNFDRAFRPISGSTRFRSPYNSLEIENKPTATVYIENGKIKIRLPHPFNFQ